MDRNALADSAQLKREIKSHIIRILNAPVRPDMAAGSGISTPQKGSPPRGVFLFCPKGAGQTPRIRKLPHPPRPEGPPAGLLPPDTVSPPPGQPPGIWGPP